jgi:hypothetical protein
MKKANAGSEKLNNKEMIKSRRKEVAIKNMTYDFILLNITQEIYALGRKRYSRHITGKLLLTVLVIYEFKQHDVLSKIDVDISHESQL